MDPRWTSGHGVLLFVPSVFTNTVDARLTFVQVASLLLQQPGTLIFHTSCDKRLFEQESELQRQHLATFASSVASPASCGGSSQLTESGSGWQNEVQHEHKRLALIWRDAVKSGVVSQEDAEFISKIMELKPEQRPNAHDLLVDPWFGTRHPDGTYYCTGCDTFGTRHQH